MEGAGDELSELLAEQAAVLDGTRPAAEEGAGLSAVLAESVVRGAITYDVSRAGDEVFVTVVSTPLTQGTVHWTAGEGVWARTLAAGLTVVFNELRSAVMPGVGGRTVVTPTGEVAWVSWASAGLNEAADAAVAARLRAAAERGVREAAQAELAGMLRGEGPTASGFPTAGAAALSRRFDEALANGAARARAAVMPEAGRLPAGVQVRTYVSADGRWAYAVAVLTGRAPEAAAMLAEAGLAGAGPGPLGGASRASGEGVEVGPDGRVRPLSSGRVTRDEDL